MKTLERILEWGGIKKDITLLIISLIALLASLFDIRPFIFDLAWISVILCGVPIVLEAIIGLLQHSTSRLMSLSHLLLSPHR